MALNLEALNLWRPESLVTGLEFRGELEATRYSTRTPPKPGEFYLNQVKVCKIGMHPPMRAARTLRSILDQSTESDNASELYNLGPNLGFLGFGTLVKSSSKGRLSTLSQDACTRHASGLESARESQTLSPKGYSHQ